MIGFFPRYHAGVVTLWNSPGPIPTGLMPESSTACWAASRRLGRHRRRTAG